MNWADAPYALHMWSGSIRRVGRSASVTSDPLILPFMMENVRKMLMGTDAEKKERAKIGTAMTGTQHDDTHTFIRARETSKT